MRPPNQKIDETFLHMLSNSTIDEVRIRVWAYVYIDETHYHLL